MWGAQTTFRTPALTHGHNSTTSRGTVLTANAAADTKGSWADLGAVAAYEYNHVIITAHVGTAGAAEFMFDIGINDSGTVYVIAEDLRLPGMGGTRSNGISISVPLRVPKGKQLAGRCQASVGSRTMEVCVAGLANGYAGAPGASRIHAIFTSSGSRGTIVTPTVANTETNYNSFIVSNNDPFRGLFFIIGPGEEYGRAANASYLLDIGAEPTNRHNVLPNIPLSYCAATDLISPAVVGPFYYSTGSGNTTMVFRCQSDVVTSGARRLDVAAYGLAPY
jgi:hypothetical protein